MSNSCDESLLYRRNLTACPYCDLLFKRHNMALHEVSVCPRCHSKVEQEHTRCPYFLKWTLIAGLLFYLPANFFPLVTVEIAGSVKSASVFDGIALLIMQGNYSTAAIVLFCSLLVPSLVLGMFSVLLVARQFDVAKGMQHFIVRGLVHLRDWSMLDIYLISFLVTMFKIKDMGQVELQLGLLAFAGLTLSINKLFISYDRAALWRLVTCPAPKAGESQFAPIDCSHVSNVKSANQVNVAHQVERV